MPEVEQIFAVAGGVLQFEVRQVGEGLSGRKRADGGGAMAAEQATSTEDGEVIDVIFAQEGGGDGGAAFSEDAGQAEAGEAVQGVGQVKVAVGGGALDQVHAEIGQHFGGLGVGIGAVADPDRNFPGGLGEFAGGVQAQV